MSARRGKVCIVQYNASKYLTRVDRAARALAGDGWEVVLIALKDDDTPGFEERDGYAVKRVALHSRRLPRGFGLKFLRFGEGVWRTFAAAWREDADVYDARDAYPLLSCHLAARLRGAALVYDADELALGRNWTVAANPVWRWAMKRYEGFHLRRAAAVITSDAGRADIMASEHGVSRPVVVRNVPETIERPDPDEDFRRRALMGKRFLLIYQGVLTPNRGLPQLIDAMRELRDCRLALVGYGPLEEELRAKIERERLQSVAEVFEAVPYELLMRYTAAADVGLIPLVGSCLSYVHAAPNKLFEYMMAGLPVVVSDLPEMAAVVREERVGTLIREPRDPSSIAAAVRELLDGPEEVRAVGARAREAALARHHWGLERDVLLDAFRSLPRRGARSPLAWCAVSAAAGALALGGLAVAPAAVSAVLALGLAGAFGLLVSERPEVGIVALIGAAALDVTGRVATVAGVQITAYQLAAAGLVAVFGVRVARRRARVPGTPADLPAAFFLAFALAAVPGAVSPKLAAVSFLSLLSSVVLLYLVVVAVDTPERGETVVWGLLAVAAVLGGLALVERAGLYSVQPVLKAWGYGIRAKTTFKDPNVFGSFLACAAAFGVPFALERRGTSRRFAAWGAVTLSVLGLVVTFSRGAWGGFLFAMVVVLVFARAPLRVKTAFVGVAGLALAVLLLRYLDPVWVREKLVDVTRNRSFMYRIYMGGSALRMWLDHPWGVGPGNYPLVFPAYRDAFVAPGLVESHTAYLTVLVETGLAGLAAFLWLVWRFLTRTARTALTLPDGAAHAVAVGALAAGVALLAQALTYSLETSKFLWLTVGLGMAAVRMGRTPRGEE